MSQNKKSAVVIGGGAYGTALANHLARKKIPVTLWAREAAIVRQVLEQHQNDSFLPGIPLDPSLKATQNLDEATRGAELVICAIPSQFLRPVLKEIIPRLDPPSILLNVAKGIETATGKLLSEVYEELTPPRYHRQIAYLSGPSFARELAEGHPSAVALGSREEAVGTIVRNYFESDCLFLDQTSDVTGVVVGGAVKNVIAIACGMADGLGYGHSTRAMFMTKGLHEMIALGKKLGADPATFHGLSGVGDLIVTCMGELSRNKKAGIEVAQGKSVEEIISSGSGVAEGLETSKAVHFLSKKLEIRLPICENVYRILYEGRPVRELFSV
ncbi:MAG: NAD(P)-dependent glycerol-3-phosphate dehydrogenase [Deltaproteobacteria bacterium]|nr:NAD(P)-dependent glycerol-3-phosphate dehydrogenase [Deltaproteobacteria bacterium]